ncbi:hypothetical protein SLA2020_523740 [Shorea laevis]
MTNGKGHVLRKTWKRIGRDLVSSLSKKKERKRKRRLVLGGFEDGRASKVRLDDLSIVVAMQVDVSSVLGLNGKIGVITNSVHKAPR